jgi:hypothetical protein
MSVLHEYGIDHHERRVHTCQSEVRQSTTTSTACSGTLQQSPRSIAAYMSFG